MNSSALLRVVVALLLCSSAYSLKVHGDSKLGGRFKYLAKFCFEEQHAARLKHGVADAFVRINAKADHPSTVFALYYDDDSSWSAAELNLPCIDKLRLARQTWYPNKPGQVGHEKGYMEWSLNIQDRPHFWYIAALNCEDDNIGKVNYNLHFENPGGFFHSEISVDKQGVLEMLFVFLLFYSIFSCVHFYTVFALTRTKSYHTLVRLFTACIMLTQISMASYFFSVFYMAASGRTFYTAEALGLFAEFAADLVFCILLILMCQGWTISYNHVKDSKMIIFTIAFLTILFMVMYIWDEYFTSAADTTYMYETWPGTIICTVRFILMLWSWNLLFKTYSDEVHPEKRRFYKKVAVVFAPWFVSLPVIVFFAHWIPPYMRFVTVEAIELTWTTFMYMVLQWLLWPSKASEYFRLTPDEQDVLGTTPYDDL